MYNVLRKRRPIKTEDEDEEGETISPLRMPFWMDGFDFPCRKIEDLHTQRDTDRE